MGPRTASGTMVVVLVLELVGEDIVFAGSTAVPGSPYG